MRRGNAKPEAPCEAQQKQFYHVTMPLPVARGLYAAAGSDNQRTTLYRSVETRTGSEGTVFAATDTRVLLSATAPVKYEIPDSLYFHEFLPFRFKAGGACLLSKMDTIFPDWRTRILPDEGMVTEQIGTFNSDKSGMFDQGLGRLEIVRGSFSLNFNFLGRLIPAVYSVHRVTDHPTQKSIELYTFDGCADGWKLRYAISGMVNSDFGIKQRASA